MFQNDRIFDIHIQELKINVNKEYIMVDNLTQFTFLTQSPFKLLMWQLVLGQLENDDHGNKISTSFWAVVLKC